MVKAEKITLPAVRAHIRSFADPERARFCERYFKTGPGGYAEGDRFLGLSAPQSRSIVKASWKLPVEDAATLLQSPMHEDRVIALLILCERYRRNEGERQRIFDLYLANTSRINNWDLVDLSAGQIVGAHLFPRGGPVITRLAKSELLWERRIAVLATFHFIRQHSFAEPLRVAKILLRDDHDLIHKAVGWMLREIGKRDLAIERQFLDEFADRMPRTMLRYAIERFPEALKAHYMSARKRASPARS